MYVGKQQKKTNKQPEEETQPNKKREKGTHITHTSAKHEPLYNHTLTSMRAENIKTQGTALSLEMNVNEMRIEILLSVIK